MLLTKLKCFICEYETNFVFVEKHCQSKLYGDIGQQNSKKNLILHVMSKILLFIDYSKFLYFAREKNNHDSKKNCCIFFDNFQFLLAQH